MKFTSDKQRKAVMANMQNGNTTKASSRVPSPTSRKPLTKFGKVRHKKVVNPVQEDDFTRVNNDVNGNPRYVIWYGEILNDNEAKDVDLSRRYEYALSKAKFLGGRKFHNKQYGGGIVFQSYNLGSTSRFINKNKNKNVEMLRREKRERNKRT